MQNPVSQTAEVLDSLKEVLPDKVVINWLWPAIIAGIFVVLGVIIERVILVHLRKLAEKTDWKGDDIIIASLKGIIITVLTIVGLFFASYSMHLPESIMLLLHKTLTVLLILSGTIMLSRMAVGFVKLSDVSEDGAKKSASILVYVARATVYLIGILIILQSLGIQITALLTALGVGGLAVALALQDTLSNMFAGIHILASRKIRTNDYIRLESGQEGNVIDIGWRTTTIKAPANHMIIVPNTRVASSIVLDFDQPEKEIIVLIPLAVSHDSDLAKVEKVTIEVAQETMKQITGGVGSYEPLIRFSAIADSSIQFNVILKVNQYNDQFVIRHEFIRKIIPRYRQEGITIPVPIQEIRMKGDR